jgi:hypothetical protein
MTGGEIIVMMIENVIVVEIAQREQLTDNSKKTMLLRLSTEGEDDGAKEL